MKKNSLHKSERITLKKEFQKVFKFGKKIRTGSFEIRYCFNKIGKRRLGIAISKRTGTAVKRNRVKRVFREWFRLNKDRLKESLDMMFFVNKDADYVLINMRETLNSIINRYDEMRIKHDH